MDRTLILRARDALNEALEPPVSRVAEFVARELHAAPGAKLTFAEFYRRFVQSVPGAERLDYTKARVSHDLRKVCTLRTGTGNVLFIRDVAFEPPARVFPQERLRFVRFDDGSGFFSWRDSSATWTKVPAAVLRTILRGLGHDSDAIKAALIQARKNPIRFTDVVEG